MPELPEAETIARSLAPVITGKTILSAAFLAQRVSLDNPALLHGKTIAGVARHGKQILIALAPGGFLHVKLGMTGALLINREPTPYTRALFTLSGGMTLQYHDIRQFGSVAILDAPPVGLGPDPLEISCDDFVRRLVARHGTLKTLLLKQDFLRGLGNIYADEALFRAELHPLLNSGRLRDQEAVRLYNAIRQLLTEAIEHRGSSISDYVDAQGERGTFQKLHRVYGRDGEACPVCDGMIARIVVGDRGTHFCPRCQVRRWRAPRRKSSAAKAVNPAPSAAAKTPAAAPSAESAGHPHS